MVMDVFLVSTMFKYDLRKEDLFVLSWAMVRRVRQGSLSSELLVCGGGVRSILLLSLVARCLETIDICIWRMFVFYVCCRDCVGVCGNVCCVAAVVKNSIFLACHLSTSASTVMAFTGSIGLATSSNKLERRPRLEVHHQEQFEEIEIMLSSSYYTSKAKYTSH